MIQKSNTMNRRRFPFPLLLLLIFFFLILCHLQSQSPLILANNNNNNNPTDNLSHLLQDVLKEISERQNWDSEGNNGFSRMEVSKVRFGTARRYEFRIRFGKKSHLLFKFPHEVGSWKKWDNGSEGFGDFVREVGWSPAVLDTFQLEGPFDLRVGGDDRLSLSLPLNHSYDGLKRILVGEGITLEVKGAQAVSLSQASNHNFTVNGSLIDNRVKAAFWPLWHSLCMPLLPIHLIGSASVVAYRSQKPDAGVETTFLSKDMIELLPLKCYARNVHKSHSHPNHSLSLNIARLHRLLRSFLDDRIWQNGVLGFVRADLKSSTVIRFQLELEKRIGSSETLLGTLSEWRTKPSVEHIWFEVMAGVESQKLKPIMIRKVRPFIAVDSASWSNLMFNISFTKFPSILVPPEPLTLDIKW